MVRPVLLLLLLPACARLIPELDRPEAPFAATCRFVEEGFGPAGEVPIRTEVVASGLEVPWSVAFLPDGAMLVSERPGRIRLVQGGVVREEPVATIEVAQRAESGLLGIALDPAFEQNRYLYAYYTADTDEGEVNRIVRFTVSEDLRATPDRVLLEGIPAARFHDGGRLRFGPDGLLYACSGDAREPSLSQDLQSPAGKILRITRDGEIPDDNPWPGSPAFVAGIRNCQAFDWIDDDTLVIADHGPSGEMLRKGKDEVNLARGGDNLGWPEIFGCEEREGMRSPILSWEEAVPPGGAVLYRGNAVPAWKGSFLVGTLRSEHLHRVRIEDGRVASHEVYLQGERGRLRDVVQGPDGAIYVTTSNCDGRGDCPPARDVVVRITGG